MRALLTGLGVRPAAADEISADLASRYAEPHRRYHTLEHITEVLAEVDRLGEPALPEPERSAVRLAVWFHDAVYDPTSAPGGNEDASAELATATLRPAGLAAPLVAEVARLVRLTADHQADPADRAGEVLADADLSILASEPPRYDRYVRDVRAEYAHVDDATWRSGRSAVLRRFLDAERIYRTGPDRWQREHAARTNLGRELTALTALRPGGVATDRDLGDDAAPPPAGGGPARAG